MEYARSVTAWSWIRRGVGRVELEWIGVTYASEFLAQVPCGRYDPRVPSTVLRRAPGSPALPRVQVRKIADQMLQELELEEAELCVLLTNDAFIHKLNREHRDKDRPTDVLAFPMDESMAERPGNDGGPRLLGDVVISLDTANRQAKGRGRPLFDEVRFLLAHGLLHLLGYDHGNPREKREMDMKTRALVRAVKRATASMKRL